MSSCTQLLRWDNGRSLDDCESQCINYDFVLKKYYARVMNTFTNGKQNDPKIENYALFVAYK